jgi:hypothetical protein
MREGEREERGRGRERWGAGREIMRYIYIHMMMKKLLEIIRHILGQINRYHFFHCAYNGGNQTGVLVQGTFC